MSSPAKTRATACGKTAEFSRDAEHEAAAEGKAKIGLLGGDALVRFRSERGVGVDRIQKTVFKPSALELRD